MPRYLASSQTAAATQELSRCGCCNSAGEKRCPGAGLSRAAGANAPAMDIVRHGIGSTEMLHVFRLATAPIGFDTGARLGAEPVPKGSNARLSMRTTISSQQARPAICWCVVPTPACKILLEPARARRREPSLDPGPGPAIDSAPIDPTATMFSPAGRMTCARWAASTSRPRRSRIVVGLAPGRAGGSGE